MTRKFASGDLVKVIKPSYEGRPLLLLLPLHNPMTDAQEIDLAVLVVTLELNHSEPETDGFTLPQDSFGANLLAHNIVRRSKPNKGFFIAIEEPADIVNAQRTTFDKTSFSDEIVELATGLSCGIASPMDW